MKGGSSPVKVRQWRRRLLRFQESGQTVAEFCRKEKVSEASLYRWRKELVNRVSSSRSRTPSADPHPRASKSRRSTAPSERSAYRYGHDVAATKSGITLPLCAECEIRCLNGRSWGERQVRKSGEGKMWSSSTISSTRCR